MASNESKIGEWKSVASSEQHEYDYFDECKVDVDYAEKMKQILELQDSDQESDQSQLSQVIQMA